MHTQDYRPLHRLKVAQGTNISLSTCVLIAKKPCILIFKQSKQDHRRSRKESVRLAEEDVYKEHMNGGGERHERAK